MKGHCISKNVDTNGRRIILQRLIKGQSPTPNLQPLVNTQNYGVLWQRGPSVRMWPETSLWIMRDYHRPVFCKSNCPIIQSAGSQLHALLSRYPFEMFVMLSTDWSSRTKNKGNGTKTLNETSNEMLLLSFATFRLKGQIVIGIKVTLCHLILTRVDFKTVSPY